MKFFQSIKTLTILFYLVIGLLFLSIFLFGILGTNRIVQSAFRMQTEYIPIPEGVHSAIRALQEGEEISHHLMLDLKNPDEFEKVSEYEERFKQTMFTFDMYAKALLWGSESEVFKKSSNGLSYAMWVRRGLQGQLPVKKSPYRIHQLVSKIDIAYTGFSSNVLSLMKSHRKALQFKQSGQNEQARLEEIQVEDNYQESERYADAIRDLNKEIEEELHQYLTNITGSIKDTHNTIQWIGITCSLTLFILIMFSAIFCSERFIINPIRILSQGVEAVEKGNWDKRVEIRVNNELRKLGDAFNMMIGNLYHKTVSKDYVDNIIKSMIDMLIVINPDGTIRTINKAVTEILGYTQTDLIGRDVGLVFEERFLFQATIVKLLTSEGYIHDYRMTYKTKSGIKIPVSFFGSLMRDQDNKVIGIVGVARDMREYDSLLQKQKKMASQAVLTAESERKRAEELEKAQITSKEIMADLENERRHLQNEIAQRKVAEEEMKKALNVRNEFTSTVSHELRTPLAISKEAVSLVLRERVGPLSEKQKEVVDMANSNLDRLGRLIDDILDVARFESGRMKLRKERMDILPVVKNSFNGWKLEADSKKIDFQLIVPENPVIISVEKTRFLQILSNLINNALKFTPESGMITVRIEETHDMVNFSVKDTGPGIAEDDLPKLFKKFQQIGRTHGPGMKGTGLGLNISKALVELHGGKIWIESKVKKGSTFTFAIPKMKS